MTHVPRDPGPANNPKHEMSGPLRMGPKKLAKRIFGPRKDRQAKREAKLMPKRGSGRKPIRKPGR
jgi:hypothetical protein